MWIMIAAGCTVVPELSLPGVLTAGIMQSE